MLTETGVHAVAHATRDQDGQLEHIAAVQDVTARRLSEEALDKARAQLTHVARIASLGVLTASIAHELNQPLSGIITNANICLRMVAADSPDVDGAGETVRWTIRDGNRASEVIAAIAWPAHQEGVDDRDGGPERGNAKG
jgi:signal transduction histidine kinase